MSDATRQQNRRKRLKNDGYVDIRVDIHKSTRDKLKTVAVSQNRTMKELIAETLEERVKELAV